MANRLVAPVVFLSLVFLAVALFQGDKKPSSDNNIVAADDIKPFELNEPISEVKIQSVDGQELVLNPNYKKTALVTLWSSSCSQCQIGLPDIEKFSQANPEIEIILIAIGEDKTTALNALKGYGVNLGTYLDPSGAVFREWSATMPASYLLADGAIRFYFPGRISQAQLTELANSLK